MVILKAVGLGSFFLKLGGLRGGERMDKYNHLMAIEEKLEQEGILGTRLSHILTLTHTQWKLPLTVPIVRKLVFLCVVWFCVLQVPEK